MDKPRLLAFRRPRFQLGRLLATPAALAALEASSEDTLLFIARHAVGDWGDVDAEDWSANDRAVVEGARILSAFTTAKGEKLWVISEADRSATTVLLPSDY